MERNRVNKIDASLIFAVFILVAFGLIMLYSASSYSARVSFGSSFYYVRKQIGFVVIGFIFMFLICLIPIKFWRGIAPWFFVVSCVLILLVRTPLGYEANGAYRWLAIGPLSIQPSEVAKFAMILLTSALICKHYKKMGDGKIYFFLCVPYAFMAVLVALVTDDLGTAIIIALIGLVMMGISTRKKKHIIITLLFIIIVGGIFILAAGYRMDRIQAWLNISEYADTTGYQVLQGLYAVGSGGFLGKFLGNGTQKLYVPEAENDMIFSVICEELGVVGAILLIILFVIILLRMKKIFDNTEDMFSRLVVAGIATHIGAQTLVNMAVVTNLMPNTGVPLPFISYGGSAIFMLFCEVGVVLRIGRGELSPTSVKAPIKFQRKEAVKE